ncbi:MAG: NPCBM/NEW2 domain-containing protein [Planctomycetota bacterium]
MSSLRAQWTALIAVSALAITAAGQSIDLGDIAVGGNGYGSATWGLGLSVWGQLVAPTVWGGNDFGSAEFVRTDGSNNTANLPYVNGVFRPVGLTPISSANNTFQFPDTNARRHDAIRNGASHFETAYGYLIPIRLDDEPGVDRPGLGIHSNQGITYDLDALRRAGYSFDAVSGVAGLNWAAWHAPQATVEVWVLVDGQQRFRQAFLATGLHSERFRIPLSPTDRYLSFACTDFDLNPYGDHGVIADAALVPEPAGFLLAAFCLALLRLRS